MQHTHPTPEERYDALIAALTDNADVTLGFAGKKGFGAAALQSGGKVFAMLSQGRLVVKVPRQRVDALVARGVGERFDPRRDGRPMREWVSIDPTSSEEWLALAREALAFVASAR